jgi:hypothetical protein
MGKPAAWPTVENLTASVPALFYGCAHEAAAAS